MIVDRLELVDFRNYEVANFDLTAGTTAVVGRNGQGKTNLAEALAYLATLTSFRSVPPEALIRASADTAVIRATVTDDDGREVLIEAELHRHGRNRVQINRQRLGRTRELVGVIRVTVFTPEDLVIVKGGPEERRRFMDSSLVGLASKYDALRLELDRVLRQRNTLLKNARSPVVGRGGHLAEVGDVDATLDVWDMRLVELGEQFGHARATLVDRIAPFVQDVYSRLSGDDTSVELSYAPEWRRTGLAAALTEARPEDRRRGVTTIGPHRDDLDITLGGLPARTHASQGEQRTLALALRLGTHQLITERTGTAPILVLDDVLSELDPGRATALLEQVPPGQVIITSASPIPPAATVDRTLHISRGTVVDTEYEGAVDDQK